MTTLTFSQGIVSHSTTTGLPGGPQNFLVINGDKVDLHAPLDQALVSVIAHRETNYLLTLQIGSDIQSWGYGTIAEKNAVFDNINGGGAGSNEYYLWIDINKANGDTTYGYSIQEPAAGSTPPYSNINRPDDLHWFDTNVNVTKVWRKSVVSPNYGNWVEVIRLFVAKYIYSASFTSLSVNSPSYIGTTVGLTGQFRAGSLIYDVIGNPVKRTGANNITLFFTTEDVFTSGLPATSSPGAGNRARYETFLVDAIGQAPVSAYSMVRFTDFEEVLPLNALSQPNTLYGMIEFPIGASGDLVQVTMSGVVRNPLWNWSTVGQQIFVDKDNDGLLITVEDDNYVPLADQLPVAVALSKTSVILRVTELNLTVPEGSGATSHGNLTDLGADDHTQYLLVNGTRPMTGDLSLSSNDIVSVGTVDGRNISTDGSTLDAHISDTSIHFTEGSPIDVGITDHTLLTNIGTNTHTQIDSHISDTSIHFTEGSPIDVGITDHTLLTNIGTNTHTQIDSHISDTSIHTALTVGEVNGSPTTSIGNVNTINFNTVSGFNVVDQTGGVVQIDLNSSFNPIIVEGGSPVQTLTASGEEPVKLIAGTNMTITGNSGASPKTITFTASGGGGGGDEITDADADTYIRVEESADEDTIRISTGDNIPGYTAQQDIITISSGGLYVDMGSSSSGSPQSGAPIRITGGYSAYSTGGDITISAGDGRHSGGSLPGQAGGLNLHAGSTMGNPSTTLAYGASINIAGSNQTTVGDIAINSFHVDVYNTQYGSGNIRFWDYGKNNAITLTSPSSISAGRIWKLPEDNPVTVQGQFLTTDNLGQWSFAVPTGGGEINTASNVGAGSGWFKQKVSTDLEFKSLVAGSSRLEITNNTNDLTLDITPAGADTQIQFNDGGIIGASSNLTWNDTKVTITTGTPVITTTLSTNGLIEAGSIKVTNTTHDAGLRCEAVSGQNAYIDFKVNSISEGNIFSDGAKTYINTVSTNDLELCGGGGDVVLSHANSTFTVPVGYESLVTGDNIIPNKKYVDDVITSGGVFLTDEGIDVGAGSPAPAFTLLDFVGSGVNVIDAGNGKATITISGGGGEGEGGSGSVIDNSYDISAQVYGTVGTTTPTRILHFISVSPFRILGDANIHKAFAETGPGTSNATFTVYHDVGATGSGVSIGTVTFTTGSPSDNQSVSFSTTSGSPNDIEVAAGDVVYIDYTSADDGTLADVMISLAAVDTDSTAIGSGGSGGSSTFTGLSDTPSALTPGRYLQASGSPIALIETDLPYDIGGSVVGVPGSGTIVFKFAVPRTITLTGVGVAYNDPSTPATTSSAVFDIHNLPGGTSFSGSTLIGTITFTTGSNIGTVSFVGSPVSNLALTASNELLVVYSSPDSGGTLGNVSFTFEGLI